MRSVRTIVPLLAFIAIAVFSVTTARADSVTFTIGNNPQSNEENVLLNSGATGTTVFGLTNQTTLQWRFAAPTDPWVEPSSGQARVEAVDGLLNNITIDLSNASFTDVIL